MKPEADRAVCRVGHGAVMELNSTVGIGDERADGIAAGMNGREVGKISGAIITPILPAVGQGVGVDW